MVAYRRAANADARNAGVVAQLALDGRAKELPGIGKTIEEKIVQIVELGEIEALDAAPCRRSGGRRQLHAPAGAGAEDRRADLAGARASRPSPS